MPRRRAAAPPEGACILVVDDSPDTLELIERHLAGQGHRIVTATGAEPALALLASMSVDLVLTDIRMPGRSGFELIHDVRALDPGIEIVVITGYATVEGAVRALQAGAWNYLAKPFTDEELFAAVGQALARRARARAAGAEPAGETYGLVGRSHALRACLEALAHAAADEGAVLLRGEAGAGRESAARVLHTLAGRPGTFQRVSLDARAAGAAELAATLAAAVHACAGGTLYLAALDGARADAMAGAGAALRPATGRARSAPAPRLVVSAGRELVPHARRARAGEFPPRFAHVVDVPPLRERGEDVLLLARHFLAEVALGAGVPVRAPGEACAQALLAYSWPGNVRELRELCARLACSGRQGPVGVGELPAAIAGELGRAGERQLSLDAAEREHVARVLQRTGGNKSRAAELLGIDRKTLREKLRGWGEALPADDEGD